MSKPVYASLMIDDGVIDQTIEGWVKPGYDEELQLPSISVQPSAEYDPDAVFFTYSMRDVQSISPMYPPEKPPRFIEAPRQYHLNLPEGADTERIIEQLKSMAAGSAQIASADES